MGEEKEVTQQGKIETQFGNLCNDLSHLQEKINNLEKKLAPILGPDVPKNSENEKERAGPESSPVAERLVGLHFRVMDLINRIDEISIRCDL
jgi:hypothetical protein